jgi:hypothetical protein
MSETGEWADADFKSETGGLYYYLRVIQKMITLPGPAPSELRCDFT